MEENRQQERNANQQNDQRIIDKTTDESGLHLQKAPKGAEQMNESFGKPAIDNQQQADALRNANTSGKGAGARRSSSDDQQ